jgi:hypothetical protein
MIDERDKRAHDTHLIIEKERQIGRSLNTIEREALLKAHYDKLSPAAIRRDANAPWDDKSSY